MVAGEPNDVRVKKVEGQWVVSIVEDGMLTPHIFDTKTSAERFAELRHRRLGLPDRPPVDDNAQKTARLIGDDQWMILRDR